MEFTDFETFNINENQGKLTVLFDNPPVNIQDNAMLNDLDILASELEHNETIKVVIFKSAHPEIFIAHADIDFLKDLPTNPVSHENVKLLNLQRVLHRINLLPQVTIAQIEGFARGGGHEFALACDLRYAARNKAIFMQMEVGMGILPCGGGTSRMARQVGLSKALEIILSARDIDANQAEKYGLINQALDPRDIDDYVNKLASRIAKFSFGAIKACKRTIYASIDLSIDDALKEEAYWLYQATSSTPAIKRFKYAHETNFQNDINNQRNFETILMDLQDIK